MNFLFKVLRNILKLLVLHEIRDFTSALPGVLKTTTETNSTTTPNFLGTSARITSKTTTVPTTILQHLGITPGPNPKHKRLTYMG